MKALQERVFEEAERRRLEADLGARLDMLFGRCPELCGFLVGERLISASDGRADVELFIADLAVYPALGAGQLETHLAQISATLSDLLNDCPAAAELLPGRTFARAVH
jgi:hypothetical protein